MKKCRECGTGTLRIIGTGYMGDTIEVECDSCHEVYEVEPDGLGMGGEEMIEAMMLSGEFED